MAQNKGENNGDNGIRSLDGGTNSHPRYRFTSSWNRAPVWERFRRGKKSSGNVSVPRRYLLIQRGSWRSDWTKTSWRFQGRSKVFRQFDRRNSSVLSRHWNFHAR